MRIGLLTNEALLLLALAFSACGELSDDAAVFSDLDRLRVLAVRSEPAALLVGEVATLSALTYEPEQTELQYAWSWCPSRADVADGGGCLIEEADLQRAWAELGTEVELPPYDLGTDREAKLAHVFGTVMLEPLCDALSAGDEQARLSCLLGLEVSVSLRVRSPDQEVTAFKSLVLLADDVDPAERNQNPALTGEVLVRDVREDRPIEAGESLVADHEYALRLVLDESVSEGFLPSALSGAGMGERRRETLVMSWFVTEGTFPSTGPFDDGDGGPFGGGERTTFVEGQNDFAALLDNRWRLPRRLGSSEATLVTVLRDERGGVGWAEQRFPLGGGQ